MSNRRRTIVAALGVLLLLIAVALTFGMYTVARSTLRGAAEAGPSAWYSEQTQTVTTPARVVRVIDGDSAIYQLEDGSEATVRMIGIDTPDRTSAVFDYYTKRPLDYAAEQLKGRKRVYLEWGTKRTDSHGQQLAYVWLEPPARPVTVEEVKKNQLNARMLLAGCAKRFATTQGTTYANTRYSDVYEACLADAQAAKRGLWDPHIAERMGAPSTFFVTPGTTQQQLVGNRRTKKFHRATCENAIKMRVENRIALISRSEALQDGFVPCSICTP